MSLLVTGIRDLPLFIAAGLALNLTPGADVALIAARSTAQGLRVGAAAALGMGAGGLLHTAAAALGLSALLARRPAAGYQARQNGWGCRRRGRRPIGWRATAPSAGSPVRAAAGVVPRTR